VVCFVTGNVQWVYFVRAIGNNGVATASSTRETIIAYEPAASSFVYIKSASVNYDKHIQVRLLIDTVKKSKAIQLDRSEDGINFTTIAIITTNPLQPDYVVEDEKLDVKKQHYFYRATVIDSCSNGRFASEVFRTFILKVEPDKENKFLQHLSWDAPQGFEAGIVGYQIYRVQNEDFQVAPIAFVSVTNLSYTDNLEDAAKEGGKIIYYLEALESLGNVYGVTNEKAACNADETYVESDLFIPNAFTPKGRNPIWLPVSHFVEKEEYSVKVFNRWGQKVFEAGDDKTGWDGANAEDGIYVYLIQYKNSRGEFVERKGTLALLKSN
jgi:hypothetical protein